MARSAGEVVRGTYQALGQGNLEQALSCLAPDAEWAEAESLLYADRSPYRGPGAVAEGVFKRFGADWEGFAGIPEQFIDAGDVVVVRGRYRGVFRATQQRVDAEFVHIWEVNEGRVIRFKQYTDTAQFARATGV